jgi:hypothetical protein
MARIEEAIVIKCPADRLFAIWLTQRPDRGRIRVW